MELFVSGDLTEAQFARLQVAAGADTIHLHGCFSDDAGLEPSFSNCEVVFGNLPASWLTRRMKRAGCCPFSSRKPWPRLQSQQARARRCFGTGCLV